MQFNIPLSAGDVRAVFFHLPKTGGTSIHNAIRDALGPNVTCPERRFDSLQLWPADQLKDFRYFSSHAPWHTLEEIPGEKRIITIVRDPVFRTLSNYMYSRAARWEYIQQPGKSNHRLMKSYSLEHLLDGSLPEARGLLSDTMTRQLAGAYLPREKRKLGYAQPWPSSDAMLEAAKQHLEDITFAGLYEDFDRSAREMLLAIGVRPPFEFPRQNVTLTNHETMPFYEEARFDQMTDAVWNLLHEVNSLDLQIYDEVKRRHCERFGSDVIVTANCNGIGSVHVGLTDTFVKVRTQDIGWAMFGPYSTLPAGIYRATFRYQLLQPSADPDCPRITFDVIGREDHVYASRTLRPDEFAEAGVAGEVTLSFLLHEPEILMQFRAFVMGGADLLLSRTIILQQTEEHRAPRGHDNSSEQVVLSC